MYRVIFTADNVDYGIAANDYADLTFTVKDTPYTVRYLINKNKDDTLDHRNYVINNPTASGGSEPQNTYSLQPVFYNTAGQEITAFYDPSARFTLAYEKYDTALSSWKSASELKYEGRYRLIIEFDEDIEIVSGAESYTVPRYNPPSENFRIIREFRIITHGDLTVTATNAGVNYYNSGNPVVPDLTFETSLDVEDVATEISGKYDLYYFTRAGASLGTTAPSAVGAYSFRLIFNSDVASLGIKAGDAFDGDYTIAYPPLAVTIGETVVFTNVRTGNAVSMTLGTDYEVSIYLAKDNLYKTQVSDAVAGSYIKRVLFKKAYPDYGISVGDSFSRAYSVGGALLEIMYESPVDKVFDGGIKEPKITFSMDVETPPSLIELVDYQVSYFVYDTALAKYVPTGLPRDAGSYRYLLTFLRTDDGKGIEHGVEFYSDFTISTKVINTTFTVKESSVDLVYDNKAKEFDVSFKKDNRPIALIGGGEDYTVAYAEQGGEYSGTKYRDAGQYSLRVTLSDARKKNWRLSQSIYAFEISKLNLEVSFTVPLAFEAMWTGNKVAPDVTYIPLSGRYMAEEKSASELQSALALGTDISVVKYYYTKDGDEIPYSTEIASPQKTGSYRQEIASNNENLVFTKVSSIGGKGGAVSSASLSGGKANQVYSIIPCEVELVPTFDYDVDDAFYYTGAENGKGIKDDLVTFSAYNPLSRKYDLEVLSFASDFQIRYYRAENAMGTINNESEYSSEKYAETGYYVARVLLKKDGTDDEYIDEKRYTFKNGKKENSPLSEGQAIEDGCYVDFVFYIHPQEEPDVIYNMPNTFTANEEEKEITVAFLLDSSTEVLKGGKGTDYEITYCQLDEEGNEGIYQSTSFVEAGKYRVKITFLKDNVKYCLNSYLGSYSGTSDLYIVSGRALMYDFEIFPPTKMEVKFLKPDDFFADKADENHYGYFTGETRSYGVSFTAKEGSEDAEGIASAVTLTRNTHYRINYYQKSSKGEYIKIASAPRYPGEYAVEVEFLKDLPDYYIYIESETIKANSKTERKEFTIEKAVLVLDGVKAEDKIFDNTTDVRFTGTPSFVLKKSEGTACGAIVESLGLSFAPEGELLGAFSSKYVGQSIEIDVTSCYSLSEATSRYYKLDDDSPRFSASITRAMVKVQPVDVVREYDPLSVVGIIDYDFSDDEGTLSSLALISEIFDSEGKESLTGNMSYSGETSVGEYPITLDALSFRTDLVVDGKVLSDLFVLEVQEARYRILPREITLVFKESGLSKVYGNTDPSEYEIDTIGRLVYRDRVVCDVERTAGENAGRYAIRITSARVLDQKGNDVTGNYRLSTESATFVITKRHLTIAPSDQTATYLEGFIPFNTATKTNIVRVLDADNGDKTFTSSIGDYLTGRLAIEATDDPFVFRILQGTVTMVNAAGKVNTNYVIAFDTGKTYTITPIEIKVDINDDAVLEKYYGDKDPIIPFSIEPDERRKLGNLTLSEYSSVAREQGEDVGEYNILCGRYDKKTEADKYEKYMEIKSFVVTDSGVDVSAYFTFIIKNLTYDGQRVFKILPRPVTITVEDVTYDNTSMEIVPVLKYLNANETKLSATLLADLLAETQIELPEIEYKEGANLVMPQFAEGQEENPNFDVTFVAGTITVNYLENIVTAIPLAESDTIYAEHKYVLSGIMLYKTVKFYRLETGNGDQPSKKVEISLPIDAAIKGDGLVALALYPDSSSKAISFSQVGNNLVYLDDGAYYVAIAEVQEWFYLIWGAVIIFGIVFLYFFTRFLIRFIKKKKERSAIKRKERAEKEAEMGELTEEQIREYASMDVALLDENMNKPSEEVSETEGEEVSSADPASLISDDAPAVQEEAPKSPIVAPAEPKEEPVAALSSENLVSDENGVQDVVTTDTSAAPVNEEPSEVSHVEEVVPEAESGKKKGKKSKEEKKSKEKKQKEEKKPKEEVKPKADKKEKKKKETSTYAPRGFKPASFMPKGDKSAAYAPTRSYQDDLFIDEQNEAESMVGAESMVSDSMISDDAIVSASKPIRPSTAADTDDEIIVSRSGSFDDLDDEENGKGDDDMI